MTPDANEDWPGTEHFQKRTPIAKKEPVFCTLLPSQDLSTLKADVCAKYEDAINQGKRPTALALAWVEFKEVEATYDERFLIGVIIDGHHKLAAYANQNMPARVLMICRVEDTWGPPEDQALWFLETTRPLKVKVQ